MLLAGHSLTIGYSERTVGRNLDIALSTGEVLALLGPNGGGKTTLLKTLLGLIAPKKGEIELCGRPLASYTSRERARLALDRARRPRSGVAWSSWPVGTTITITITRTTTWTRRSGSAARRRSRAPRAARPAR